MEKKIVFIILAMAALIGCQPQQSHHAQGDGSGGDTLEMRHAKLLTLIERDSCTEVIIRNPWNTAQELHRFMLCQENALQATAHAVGTHGDASSPARSREGRISIPLHRAVLFSSVHSALLEELGCLDAVAGVCDAEYFMGGSIKARIESGRVQNMGSGMMPNTERLLALSPDALLASTMEDDAAMDKLRALGLWVVDCVDYMEVSPLARAEWMRFYGRLFGKGEQADSLFAVVEAEYTRLRHLAQLAQARPLVVAELPYGGKWHVAAGGSTAGQLYADAGARYAFAHLPGAGSRTLSIEQVLEKVLEADCWMVKGFGEPMGKAQLTSDIPGLAQCKAQLWYCNTQQSLFFEQTPFRPDWLLANLVRIFHPEVKVEAPHSYYQMLE